MSSENEETELTDQAVKPDKSDVIEAYIQYSEESRYRDNIMHNSYYFVLIAVVLFTGQILSIDVVGVSGGLFKLGVSLFSGGIVLFSISVVMKTYNRKRINAEEQRQVLENILDEYYTETGIQNIDSNSEYATRRNDNPFAIQEMVIGRNKGYTEGLFIEKLPISEVTKWSLSLGILIAVLGLGVAIGSVV